MYVTKQLTFVAVSVSLGDLHQMKLVLRRRTGSSENQLHLMKVSERERNVNKSEFFGFVYC